MQYRDVHNIIPKSYMWKFPSQGSIKYEENNLYDKESYFKWDFKTPYRESIYFVRRLWSKMSDQKEFQNAVPISDQEIKELSQSDPNWKGNYIYNIIEYYEDVKFVDIRIDHLTLEEKHEYYYNAIKGVHETIDYGEKCNFKLFKYSTG
jgi:hypothetical protein